MTAMLLALGYAFCWGVGVTLTKLALSAIGATTLLLLQLFSGVVFLMTLCYCKDRRLPCTWRHLKQGMAGIFEPALAYMFGIFGVQLTTASNASLIGSSEVILTILLAALFLGEGLTRPKLLLAALSFLGVALLMVQTGGGGVQSSLLGDGLVLVGTLFAVGYVLCSKRQIATAEPLHLTTAQQLVGLVVTVVCFGCLSWLNPAYEVSVAGISAPFLALAIASGIMQYALAFLIYLMALRTIPASQAAFYTALIPLFGVASAMVLMGEQPSLIQWVGGGLVMVSAYCAHRLGVA